MREREREKDSYIQMKRIN